MNNVPRPSLLDGANLLELSPLHIDEGDRIGLLHEDKAAALGRLMAVDGQRDPIKVVKHPVEDSPLPWKLVTGMHRLIGARIEGLTVWAIEVSGKPEDLADLEASENLHRRPLAPIERAKFVHALVAAAQERIARQHGTLSQHKLGAKARWAKVRDGQVLADKALHEESDDAADKLSAAYGWQESAADAFGLDKRSIRRALELYRLIIEPFGDLVEQLAAHPVVGENASQLKLIAEVKDDAHRRRVIEMLVADPELSADEARVRTGIDSAHRAPTPFEKFTSQVSGGLGRLSAAEQKRALPNVAASLKSDEVKRQLRDMLSEQLGDNRPEPARRVGVVQAADVLADAIGAINRLLEGEGVDDEELSRLRAAAQGVVFDIPDEAPAEPVLTFDRSRKEPA